MLSYHVVPHINDEASGPSLSVRRLCESLVELGDEVGLICAAAGAVDGRIRQSIHPQFELFGNFAFSRGITAAIRAAFTAADIVHNHSLWAYPNVVCGLMRSSDRAHLVTSPRGTLSHAAMSRSAWKKGVLGPMQWRALTRASVVHATSEQEFADIRGMGFRQPIAIIPNGIDVPEASRSRFTDLPRRTALYLGRLHPIKGLELLLSVWRSLTDRHPDWDLVVAGKGDVGYVQELESAAAGIPRVRFVGPVYGPEKVALYDTSELFVLPTTTENFGMVVAESLALGVPVITTKNAPWRGLKAHGCGWWVDRDSDSFGAGLQEALNRSRRELRLMGERGRDWMLRDFAWSNVSCQMHSIYEWLVRGGQPPACVRLD